MKEQPSNRTLLIGGAGVLVVACFVAGYAFATRDTSSSNVLASGHPGYAAEGAVSASLPSLNDLLPGLEAKVAANPGDIGQRLLLAQTYSEVGKHDESLQTLRAIHKDAPADTRATILLATQLIESDSPKDLREAFALLDDAVRRKPGVEVMARLYQGDIRIKLGDMEGAQAIWRKELTRLAGDDPRRAMYETKLAQLAAAR